MIYGLGGAAARSTGLILLPLYTRAFGTENYGLLQIVTNLGALLFAVSVLGLDGAASILFFAAETPLERQRVATLWVAVSVLVSLPLTLLLIVFAEWVSFLAGGTSENADLFRLGIAVLPFSLLQFVFSSILRMYFRARVYALLNFALTLLVLVISIYLLQVQHMGLYGALWGTLAGTAVVCLFGAWTVRDWVKFSLVGRKSWPLARRMLRLGAPLVPASVALWVIGFSNTYFLFQLAGPGEAGIFRVGAQLAAILGLGVWAFQLAWLPFSLSIAKEPDAPQVYSRVATLYTAGGVGAAVGLAGVSPVALLVANPSFAPASAVIGLLALAAVSLGSYYVVSVGVNIAQRTGQVGWTTLLAAAANLALNALLIPVWGIVGAGLASLAANLLSTVLVYLASQRFNPLPYEARKITAIWLVGSACVAAAAVFNVSVQPTVPASLAFAPALACVYAAALFLSRAVTLRDLAVLRSALRARYKGPEAE